MDAKLRKLFIRMTKITMYAMVFCISLTIGICSTAGAQQKLLKEISIELNHKEGSSLIKVIKEIEKSSNFLFLYSPKELRDINIDLNTGIWNMSDLLHDISAQAKLSIKRVNETISVTSVGTKRADVVDLIITQQQITGKITDDKGEALPGASVVVSGTTTGTITDIDGNYALTVPSDAKTVDVSFVGMKTMTVDINNRSVIDVQLIPDVGQLDEVVVIGYGERQKKDLTSSISVMNAKAIEESPYLSPELAMQGRMAGVRVVNNSGSPNSAPQIFVRGIGTFAGESQPLYVVDGQIITQIHAGNRDGTNTQTNLWNMIDPNDIESISVLKDASAAAIYGNRAANGVILITTKRGKIGTPKVEFNTRTGFSTFPTFDVLNTQELEELTVEAWSNNANPNVTLNENLYGRNVSTIARLNGYAPVLDPQSPFYLGGSNAPTYDWQEEVINRTAALQDYDVKISGATENFDYYFSVGYATQEHQVKGGGDVERYNITSNINSHLGKYISTGATIRIGYNNVDRQAGQLYEYARVSPWQPLYEGDAPGIYGNPNPEDVRGLGWAVGSVPYVDSIPGAWNMVKLYGEQTKINSIAQRDLNYAWSPEIRNMGQGYIKITPLEGLSIRGGLSIDHVFTARRSVTDIREVYFSYQSTDPSAAGDGTGTTLGSAGVRQFRRLNYQADLTVNYNRTFGEHTIDATFIAQDSYYKSVTEDFSNTQTNGTLDPDRILWTNDATSISFLARYEGFWYGYAGRLSYSYGGKYYLDASLRRDASSGFPEDKDLRWGIFPAVSGAWRISDESFFSVPFINNLKIRGGWGQAGNDENAVGRFAYLSTVANQGSYAFGSGANGRAWGPYQQSILLTSFPNKGLSWETGTTSYVGFDAVMLNNKFNASIEFYNKVTSGILQSVVLPFVVGTLDPLQNIGEVSNRGIDIELDYSGNLSDFQYNIGGNIAFVKNEVTSLYEGAPIQTGLGRVEEGRSIGHIWGYKVGGIFQSDQEVLDHFDGVTMSDTQHDNDANDQPLYVEAGDMWFQNIGRAATSEELDMGIYYSTELDSVINQWDQTELGKTIPSFTYGLNLSGTWKGFDVSLNWYGEVGAYGYNSERADLESMQSRGVNQFRTTLDRWTETNPSNEMPRAVAGDPAGNLRTSDRFVERKDFFRLQNWTIGYSLPQRVISNIDFLSRLRVYIGGQNNLYFFRWTGVDPVASRTPLPRSVWFGTNISF